MARGRGDRSVAHIDIFLQVDDLGSQSPKTPGKKIGRGGGTSGIQYIRLALLEKSIWRRPFDFLLCLDRHVKVFVW